MRGKKKKTRKKEKNSSTTHIDALTIFSRISFFQRSNHDKMAGLAADVPKMMQKHVAEKEARAVMTQEKNPSL